MRRVLLVAFVAIVGCDKPDAPAAPPTLDPLIARREADASAAFEFDAACASLEEALIASKKLAPTAGGDAKDALLDVTEMLDSAGATLADHVEEPPPLETYRKQEPAKNREAALKDSVDALQELRQAWGILTDLAENVPKEHAAPLVAIQDSTGEAIDAVKSGIGHIGGKVPVGEP